MPGAAGAVRPVLVLGDKSLQAHQAGVPKKVRADLALFEIGQEDAVDASGKQPRQVSLSHAQRQLADVLAISDQNVEGVELHFVVMFSAVQSVEVRPTIDAE